MLQNSFHSKISCLRLFERFSNTIEFLQTKHVILEFPWTVHTKKCLENKRILYAHHNQTFLLDVCETSSCNAKMMFCIWANHHEWHENHFCLKMAHLPLFIHEEIKGKAKNPRDVNWWKNMLKKGREHVRTLREGRRQFLWRKTIPLICLVSSKSRKSTFMNAYHLQILPPHMLAQGFLKNPSMVFYELSRFYLVSMQKQ